jgi:hypothetical protein
MEDQTTLEHLKEKSILRLVASSWGKGSTEVNTSYPLEEGLHISVQVFPGDSPGHSFHRIAKYRMITNEGDFLIEALTKVAQDTSSEGISRGEDLFNIHSKCPYDTILVNARSFHLFRNSTYFSPEYRVVELKKGNMGVLRGATVLVSRCVPQGEIFLINKSSVLLEEVSPFSEEVTGESYKASEQVRLHFTSPDVVRLKVA